MSLEISLYSRCMTKIKRSIAIVIIREFRALLLLKIPKWHATLSLINLGSLNQVVLRT